MTDTATDLRATLASLNHGDVATVTFTDLGVMRGRLCMTTQTFDCDGHSYMVLDVYPYPMVRRSDGTPASQVVSVEPWDEDRWFARLGELWTDYQEKDFEADHCSRSEQGPARLARDEARVAWLDEVKAGPR